MNCRRWAPRLWILCSALVFLAAVPARAADPPLAIEGYDSVAYFTEKRPVEGKPEFAYDWDGMRYRFSSAANRDRFSADPDRYAPRFAGNCAAVMAATGRQVPANPKNWLVVDGKLYLFAGEMGPARFEKDPSLIKQADAKWAAQKKPAN